MATAKWIKSTRVSNPITILSNSDLTSIANGAGVLSGVISNTSDLDMYMDLYLTIIFGSAPTANTTMDAYLVRSSDGGTTFEVNSASRPPANGAIGSFVLNNTATTLLYALPNVLLPPGSFRVLLVNSSGVTTDASTGKIMTGDFYNQQIS